jgi:GDPmannose 4,6-dehydratase
VREFIEAAFTRLGLDWEQYVAIDPRYFRPAEVDFLQGDASKARAAIGWTPKVGFRELVEMMVDADMEKALAEQTLATAGHAPQWRGSRG